MSPHFSLLHQALYSR